MQQPDAIVAIRWPNLWEQLQRLSGLSAIVMLGLAMIWLAVHADSQSTAPRTEHRPAAVAPVAAEPAPPIRTPAQAYTLKPALPEVVFYVYSDKTQYLSALNFEAQAANEAAEDMSNTQHEFYTLDVSTPESDRQARDTIYAAVVGNTTGSRIVVRDLRQQ
jgi:hypothetical protein